jgi:hypothetical protein
MGFAYLFLLLLVQISNAQITNGYFDSRKNNWDDSRNRWSSETRYGYSGQTSVCIEDDSSTLTSSAWRSNTAKTVTMSYFYIVRDRDRWATYDQLTVEYRIGTGAWVESAVIIANPATGWRRVLIPSF